MKTPEHLINTEQDEIRDYGPGKVPRRVTPDELDRLMRRMYIMEQKMALYDKDCAYPAKQLEELYDMQGKIVKELLSLRKMAIKIGTALIKKAVK